MRWHEHVRCDDAWRCINCWCVLRVAREDLPAVGCVGVPNKFQQLLAGLRGHSLRTGIFSSPAAHNKVRLQSRVFFCCVCGYWSESRTDGLLKPCQGKPEACSHGAVALARIANGRHPAQGSSCKGGSVAQTPSPNVCFRGRAAAGQTASGSKLDTVLARIKGRLRDSA